MAIIIGVKQSAKTYQILQEKNNFSYINSSNSSNLLFLNFDENTNNNAVIRFKNNYEVGYIDNNISIFNTSNLLTINNSNIHLYKHTYLHCNLNVDNYLYTSNDTTYFNNNIQLSLNNNSNNSFKITYDNNPIPIFEVSKNSVHIKSPNIYTSNITLTPNSTLYTNFIDSPNDKPVVINNMAFAESLRIYTANIIQNVSINNDILFTNLISSHPEAINPYTIVTDDEWTQYMINNNINELDPLFIKPNINVMKYLSSNNNNIGGSNILEFNVKFFNSSNSNLIFAINNKGYLSIGSNQNLNIPLKINIAPESSNIIQYTNINDVNKCYAINSNGFMNIGSINYSPNQVNIYKNNNYDRTNTDLISLNINNNNNSSNNGNINVTFNNNSNYTDFKFDYSYDNGSSTASIIITNYFIINNILPLGPIAIEDSIYYNNILYNNVTYNATSDSYVTIRYPINGIVIAKISESNNILIFKVYQSGLNEINTNAIIDADINNTSLFNKIAINKTIKNIKVTFIFYIYIGIYTYIYTGKYYPKFCNYLTAKTNNLTYLNISQKGNVGIGTTYSDIYKLYIDENALINNINCKTIDNYLTKNISMCNCILNDIDIINDVKVIKSDYLISSNNYLSNLINNNCIINSNLTILSNGGKFIVNTTSIFGQTNINPYANYLMTINCSNINDGLAIKNDIINNNPNLLIYSSCVDSYPYIKLQSSINSYNIGITSSNNFKIKFNNSNISIIENNYSSSFDSISLLNNCLNIFKDNENNIKFYAGKIPGILDWHDYVARLPDSNLISKSSFNIYGNFNVYSTIGDPIINCRKNLNNDYVNICIGIEKSYDDINFATNNLLINYNTTFNSNISVLNNIYLSGTILSVSDCNLKTNIIKIENPLDKIETISGYTYKRTDTGNFETGLIAQEVIKILPEVINYNTNNNYTISYGTMAGILVECIKELNEKIKLLNNRIDKLELK